MIYNREPLAIKNNIRIFSGDKFYWGVTEREEMQEFIKLAREVGYKKAREEFSFKLQKLNYVEEFGRADFHFLLPLEKDAVILDLGSGYGNLTIPLAKYYGKIIAADVSEELLEFIKLRAEPEGAHNIEYVKIDPLEYLNLPFAKGSFDAVIMSGLLEWVGAAKLDEKPQALQQKVLNYLAPLLKENGLLYIAIENRLFPAWAVRDPHSKLSFTSVFPRPLANWYAKTKGIKDGYRTYIYSCFGYLKMLRQAGFNFFSFLYPYAGYRSPSFIYPETPGVRNFIFKKGFIKQIFTKKWVFVLQFCHIFGLEKLWVSSFMMVAKKGKNNPPLSLIELAEEAKVGELLNDDELLKVRGNGNNDSYAHFYLFRRGDSKPYGNLKILRNPPSRQSAGIQITAIEKEI